MFLSARVLECGEEWEIVVEETEEDSDVFEQLDLFVLVEDLEEDMLRLFSPSKELVDTLFMEGEFDGDESNFEARYALNWCSDSAGVMDRSGLDKEFFEVGRVSFHISS